MWTQDRFQEGSELTLVQIGLIEVVGSRDVHVVQASDLHGWAGQPYQDCMWMRQGDTYVAVATEVLEQLDFSQGALGQDLLAEDIGDLLDGDAFAGLGVRSGTAMAMVVSTGQLQGGCPKFVATVMHQPGDADAADEGEPSRHTYQTIPYAP